MSEARRAGRAPLAPDDVTRIGFSTSFRGFDHGEVREFQARVAAALRDAEDRIRDLENDLQESRRTLSLPELDEATLTAALGDEAGRILASAREAAADVRQKAEANVARILRDAHEQADAMRSEAENVLARRTSEAENAAAGIVEAARADAEALLEAATEEGEARIAEAEAFRADVLGDLARRRRSALAQIEQLRAGKERLLDAYRVVRRSLEDTMAELQRAEPEARAAAENAGLRAAAEPAATVEELERTMATRRDLAPPAQPESDPAPEADRAPERGLEAVAEPAAPDGGGGDDDGEWKQGSALRIIRPKRDGRGDDVVELEVVQPPSQSEGVRILRPDPAPESEPAPEPAPEPELRATPEPEAEPELPVTPEPEAEPEARSTPEPDPEPPARPSVSRSTRAAVDDLFARIKADRADAVARARETVAAVADAPPRPVPSAAETRQASDASPQSEPELAPAPEPAAEPEPEPDEAPDDEAVLRRRDGLLGDVEQRLARRLKRALQDDQNDLLDRLRSTKGAQGGVAPVVPDAARYVAAGTPLLAEAADGGARFAGASGGGVDVADLATDLATAIAGPLERRLARAGGEDDDADAVFERIGAAFREWKTQRIERVAADSVAAAFARGAYAAFPPATPVRWVVDDDGGHCPDCDDNALAGFTPTGQPFPTGQLHPPAHAGCRCLLEQPPL